MKYKVLFLLTLSIAATVSLQAQLNVGSTAPADVSAILQATSITKGFLPPVMTTTQINAIVLPANGLTVYNTTLSQLQVNVGTPLVPSWAVGAGGANVYWSQQGNTGTVPGTNYVGTTDNASLAFSTNNAERVRIDSSTGFVGIGTTTPHAPLQFANTVVTRKMVLLDQGTSAGNDSAFYGFGINSATLRYQVPAGMSHSFYINKTLVANIGPAGTMTINGTNPAYSFTDRSRTNRFGNLYVADGIIRLWGSQNADLFSVDSIANVGIGTIASYAPLQFANTAVNRKIVLYDVGTNVGNDSAFYGLGINSSTLRYQVPAGAQHSFYSNKTLVANINAVGITTAGNLQVGTTASGTTTDSILTINSSTGIINKRSVTSVGNQGGIYSNDGTLSGSRTVTQATNNIYFKGGNVLADSILYVDYSNKYNGNWTGTSPSIRFGNGSGEAIVSNRAGSINSAGLDLFSANVSRMSITNGGNVGIGTQTPATKLQIVAGDNNSTTNIVDAQANNLSQGTSMWYGGLRSTGSNPSVNLNLDSKGSSPISLNANTGSGNVGIGTTGPSYKLDVIAPASSAAIRIGDGGSGGGIIFGNANHGIQRGYPVLGAGNNVGLYTTSANIYLSANGAGNVNQFVLTNGGAVGINMGAASPSQILQVNGNIKAGTDNIGSAWLSQGGSNQSGYLSIYKPDGVTRMGYIGADVTNLYYSAENGAIHKFQGAMQVVAPDDNGNAIIEARTGNYTQGCSLWYGGVRATGTIGDVDLRLTAKGNGWVYLKDNFILNSVGIYLTGAMNASGGYSQNSDRRLKRNIVGLTGALGQVMKLIPYSYEKKATIASTDYNTKELGFIAQDVRKVLPQLVSEGMDKDKTLSLNYTALIPLLTKAIQEQQAQNDTQVAKSKAQNDAQTALNKKQQAQIETQVADIALLKKENLVIAAQLSDIKELKIAMAQLRSELNKTSVTQVALPTPVTVNN